MTDRYAASIAGIAFEAQDLSDGFDKAIARYDIPYRDGTLTEDMGTKERTVRIRCYFYGPAYEAHKELLAHLQSRELFELLHPAYGLIRGRIPSIHVRHDDRELTAEIDIEFLEHLRGTIEYERRPDIRSETREIYEQGVAESMQSFSERAAAELGSEGTDICSRALDAGTSALSQLTGLSRKATAWVKGVDRFVAGAQGVLTEVAIPPNSIVSGIDFGLGLPGRVIGAIARTAERYSILYDSLKAMPEQFLDNLQNASDDLAAVLGNEGDVRAGFALRAGLDLGGIYGADEDSRDLARVLEGAQSFNTLGQYIKPAPTPELLDVGRIERSLAAAMAMIQDALDADRSLQSLKDLARELTDHAIRIKIEAERLVTFNVDNETPLHLLCLQRGLPYNYAERLVKVNEIPFPNAVTGEVRVYVR